MSPQRDTAFHQHMFHHCCRSSPRKRNVQGIHITPTSTSDWAATRNNSPWTDALVHLHRSPPTPVKMKKVGRCQVSHLVAAALSGAVKYDALWHVYLTNFRLVFNMFNLCAHHISRVWHTASVCVERSL
eukprot:2490903-Amphidinium_carterae.1